MNFSGDDFLVDIFMASTLMVVSAIRTIPLPPLPIQRRFVLPHAWEEKSPSGSAFAFVSSGGDANRVGVTSGGLLEVLRNGNEGGGGPRPLS